jgi:hypothetical protein
MEYMQPGRGGAEGTMQKRVYMLDGSDSKNPGFGGQEQVSKATWQAGKLVITSTTQFGETKQTLSLVGGNLNVEQTNPGREGGAPTTTTIVYKKAS